MDPERSDVPDGDQGRGTSGWTRTPLTADLVRGALELEHTAHGVLPHRLPAWARAQVPDGQLAMAEAQPSGVRLVFRTRATAVELDTLPTKRSTSARRPAPTGSTTCSSTAASPAGPASRGGNTLTIDMATGAATPRPGPVGTLRFAGLPGRRQGRRDLAAAQRDHRAGRAAHRRPRRAAARPAAARCGCTTAARSATAPTPRAPTTTWPALAAALGGVDLVNLGFGGSALLDPFTARALRDTPADLISVKIGINLVNTDLMRLRAFAPAVHGFLDTIREGHPTRRCWSSRRSCARSTRTPRGPAPRTSAGLGEGRLRFVATGDPADAHPELTLRRHP